MSMYVQFLSIALDQASHSDGPPTTGQALGRLLQCRGRMDGVLGVSGDSGGAPGALSRELEYDVALITLARLVGIQSQVEAFDQPPTERLRLERALVDQGIRLDELETSMGEAQ